jgi:hypothetical protein
MVRDSALRHSECNERVGQVSGDDEGAPSSETRPDVLNYVRLVLQITYERCLVSHPASRHVA